MYGMTNVFEQDAFSVATLTDAINRFPFLPGQVGRLGIFAEKSVPTTKVAIEERNGVLYLVPNTLRGAPPTRNPGAPPRTLRSFDCTHLVIQDRVQADDAVQNVREFGTVGDLKTTATEVNERLATMSNSLDATLEHLRIGAIKGLILDADGTTTIYNLFDEFGVAAPDEVDFDLDNANPAEGSIRRTCARVVRTIAGALGGMPFEGVHAFCGDAFFDDLVNHPETRETFLNQAAAAELRSGYAFGRFSFGGITFENYRGRIGATDFVHTDAVHFLPVGVPGLFVNYFAPADYVEAANTPGLPKYAKVSPDPQFQKWVDLEAQSNPLPICTRPEVLVPGKRT